MNAASRPGAWQRALPAVGPSVSWSRSWECAEGRESALGAEWNVGILPLACPCCVSLTPLADVSLLHRRVRPRGSLSDRARRSGYGGGRGLARTARGEGSRVTGGVVVAVDCHFLNFFFT